MRKRCHRRPIVPVPPRGLRPKLGDDQVRDLALCHLVNLDVISRGQADESTLWQWAGGVLTWSRVAEVLGVGLTEMRQQLDLATDVLHRYQTTRKIGFSGPQYQLAKAGVDVMDQLARLVDRPAAIAAAEWSERRVEQMSAECAAREAA
ncbi:hypothetical protein [Methylibium sp.]|uniref:hypothetical protein n=1 Tax=Methylibium sp. TaxID=2067992 RepID=UPI003D14FB29